MDYRYVEIGGKTYYLPEYVKMALVSGGVMTAFALPFVLIAMTIATFM